MITLSHEGFKVCLYILNSPSLRAKAFTFLKPAKKLILPNLDKKKKKKGNLLKGQNLLAYKIKGKIK